MPTAVLCFRVCSSTAKNMKRENKAKIHFVIGEVNAGKTSFVRKIIAAAKKRQLKCYGFLSEAVYRNGQKESYMLRGLHGKNSIKLCSLSRFNGSIPFKKFYFNPEAICAGNAILEKDYPAGSILVIDEAGPLELSGNGWSIGIRHAIKNHQGNILLVCRSKLVLEISTCFDIPYKSIYNIQKTNPDQVLGHITA